jgi:release factor glutamine methyltransferase
VNSISVDRDTWTILSLIEWSADHFSSKSVDSPRLTAELLLCHVLTCQRIELYTNFDRVLSPDELTRYKACFKRRLAHEPVQYIVGSTEFMGLKLEVDRRTLIPRPETELLVEQVAKRALGGGSRPIRILDIGTGSGNIAVSLARLISSCEVIALDVSTDALDVANRNAELHAVEGRVKLVQYDIMNRDGLYEAEPFDFVVSNPPYIPAADIPSLPPEVRDYEPLIALRDSGDGLSFFRRIGETGARLLKEDGSLFVEIGFDQGEAVRAIFRDLGYAQVGSFKDYAGIDRVIEAAAPTRG